MTSQARKKCSVEDEPAAAPAGRFNSERHGGGASGEKQWAAERDGDDRFIRLVSCPSSSHRPGARHSVVPCLIDGSPEPWPVTQSASDPDTPAATPSIDSAQFPLRVGASGGDGLNALVTLATRAGC